MLCWHEVHFLFKKKITLVQLYGTYFFSKGQYLQKRRVEVAVSHYLCERHIFHMIWSMQQNAIFELVVTELNSVAAVGR